MINKHHWAIYGKKKKQQVGFLFLQSANMIKHPRTGGRLCAS